MRTGDNGQKRRSIASIIFVLFGAFLLAGTGLVGCDIIEEDTSTMKKIEKMFQKEAPESSEPVQADYKTTEESTTLKIIAVDPHADLKALGERLAREAKDKPLFEVDVYDDENEARNYRVRFDPNITPEDAAYEDNWEHLVAIYRKNTNTGDNYIEIYNDISHEDVEIIKF